MFAIFLLFFSNNTAWMGRTQRQTNLFIPLTSPTFSIKSHQIPIDVYILFISWSDAQRWPRALFYLCSYIAQYWSGVELKVVWARQHSIGMGDFHLSQIEYHAENFNKPRICCIWRPTTIWQKSANGNEWAIAWLSFERKESGEENGPKTEIVNQNIVIGEENKQWTIYPGEFVCPVLRE